jgi:hypothetical protein
MTARVTFTIELDRPLEEVSRILELGKPWCHLCPLWDGEWATCHAILEEREGRMMYRETGHDTEGDGAPEWCPLRTAPVLVRLASAPKE